MTGVSVFGDGVFRVDEGTQTASILLGGFHDLKWLDLAIESDDTILAVGFKYDQATGVYRVDPTTGVASVLNNSHGWQLPTAVAVDTSDQIYVADAGVCADGICTGGEIVHVDPVTGVATQVSDRGADRGRAGSRLHPGAGPYGDAAVGRRAAARNEADSPTVSAPAAARSEPGSKRAFAVALWVVASTVALVAGFLGYVYVASLVAIERVAPEPDPRHPGHARDLRADRAREGPAAAAAARLRVLARGRAPRVTSLLRARGARADGTRRFGAGPARSWPPRCSRATSSVCPR